MANEFQERRAYDSMGREEYCGRSEPGTGEGESKWIIEKYSYTGIQEGSKKYPNGSNKPLFIWRNRTSYRYR